MFDPKRLMSTTAFAALIAASSAAAETTMKADAELDTSIQASAENAVEETGDALETGADAVADAAGDALDAAQDTASDIADAAANTAEDVENAAQATVASARDAAEDAGNWIETKFDEIADRPIDDILGADVHLANGEDVGEVDNIGIKDGDVVALLGIGGFLGLAENNVAIDIQELSWDGEKFILDGYTQEQLSEMPEYDSAEVRIIEETNVEFRTVTRM